MRSVHYLTLAATLLFSFEFKSFADISWEISDYDTFHQSVLPKRSSFNGLNGMLPARYRRYGTQMALLTNGEVSLRARLQTLRAAKKSIRLLIDAGCVIG